MSTRSVRIKKKKDLSTGVPSASDTVVEKTSMKMAGPAEGVEVDATKAGTRAQAQQEAEVAEGQEQTTSTIPERAPSPPNASAVVAAPPKAMARKRSSASDASVQSTSLAPKKAKAAVAPKKAKTTAVRKPKTATAPITKAQAPTRARTTKTSRRAPSPTTAAKEEREEGQELEKEDAVSSSSPLTTASVSQPVHQRSRRTPAGSKKKAGAGKNDATTTTITTITTTKASKATKKTYKRSPAKRPSLDELLTSPFSPLAEHQDLKSLINYANYMTFTDEERRELGALLPPCILQQEKYCAQGQLTEGFFKYCYGFSDFLNEWQDALAAGIFTDEYKRELDRWQHDPSYTPGGASGDGSQKTTEATACAASTTKAAQDYNSSLDKWKDEAFEEYYGEKAFRIHEQDALAGESVKILFPKLGYYGALKLGDQMRYRKVFEVDIDVDVDEAAEEKEKKDQRMEELAVKMVKTEDQQHQQVQKETEETTKMQMNLDGQLLTPQLWQSQDKPAVGLKASDEPSLATGPRRTRGSKRKYGQDDLMASGAGKGSKKKAKADAVATAITTAAEAASAAITPSAASKPPQRSKQLKVKKPITVDERVVIVDFTENGRPIIEFVSKEQLKAATATGVMGRSQEHPGDVAVLPSSSSSATSEPQQQQKLEQVPPQYHQHQQRFSSPPPIDKVAPTATLEAPATAVEEATTIQHKAIIPSSEQSRLQLSLPPVVPFTTITIQSEQQQQQQQPTATATIMSKEVVGGEDFVKDESEEFCDAARPLTRSSSSSSSLSSLSSLSTLSSNASLTLCEPNIKEDDKITSESKTKAELEIEAVAATTATTATSAMPLSLSSSSVLGKSLTTLSPHLCSPPLPPHPSLHTLSAASENEAKEDKVKGRRKRSTPPISATALSAPPSNPSTTVSSSHSSSSSATDSTPVAPLAPQPSPVRYVMDTPGMLVDLIHSVRDTRVPAHLWKTLTKRGNTNKSDSGGGDGGGTTRVDPWKDIEVIRRGCLVGSLFGVRMDLWGERKVIEERQQAAAAVASMVDLDRGGGKGAGKRGKKGKRGAKR